MDNTRFDSLAKVVGTWTTRRTALTLLAGLGLGNLDLADADAKKSGKCKPECNECTTCKKGKCKKSNSGKKKCKKGKCQPLPLGILCTLPTGGICQNGICDCAGGMTNCSGSCVNTKTNEANCGTCGTGCTANQVCQEGSCFPKSTCPATITSYCVPPNAAMCGATCYCGVSAEGNILCLENENFCTSGDPLCETSATCPTGEACVDISGCCPTPFPAGSKICLARCAAPTAAGAAAAGGGRPGEPGQ